MLDPYIVKVAEQALCWQWVKNWMVFTFNWQELKFQIGNGEKENNENGKRPRKGKFIRSFL